MAMCPQMSGSASVWANRYRPRLITRAITAREAGGGRSPPRAGPVVTAADPAESVSRHLLYGVDLPSRPRYRKKPPTSRITAINQEPMGVHALVTMGKRMKTMPNRIASTPTIFMSLPPSQRVPHGRAPGHDRPAPRDLPDYF